MIRILALLIVLLFSSSNTWAQSWIWNSLGRFSIDLPGPRVYRYGYDNLRVSPKPYASIELKVEDFEEYGEDDIATNINAKPSIRTIKLDLKSFRNKVDYTPRIDFGKFEHIEFLYLGITRPLDTATWHSILDMPSLKYLHISQHTIPKEIQPALFDKLEGLRFYADKANIDTLTGNIKELIIERYKHEGQLSLAGLDSLQFLSISGDSLHYDFVRELEQKQGVRGLRIRSKTDLDLRAMNRLESIDISGSNIQIELPKSVRKIDISSIEPGLDLQGFFNKYSWIEELELSYNRPKKNFVVDIAGLDRLKSLRIKGVPEKVKLSGLESLETFDHIFNDSLKTLVGLNAFRALKHVDLTKSALTELPSELYKCTELQELNLSNSEIMELDIPENSWNNLRSLNLRDSKLNRFTVGNNSLKKLEDLNLSNSLLKDLEMDFSKTPEIKKLSLDNTCIRHLDSSFQYLNKLESFSYTKIQRSSLFKEEVGPLCMEFLDSFPVSFATFRKLRKVDLQGHVGIGVQALQVLSESLSDSISLNISSTGLNEFPEVDWSQCSFIDLDLSRNTLGEIPKELLECPLMKINLNRTQLGIMDRRATSKNQVALLKYHAGIISKDSLMTIPNIAQDLIKVSSGYYSKPEENPILEYYPMALELDSVYTVNKISKDNFAEALFKAKRYKEALPYYNEVIEEKLSSNIRFSNDIASNINDRSEIHLFLGDTLSAIKDLKLIDEEFSFDMKSDIYTLLLETGQFDEANELAPDLVKYYQEIIDSRKNNIAGLQLSILEIYAISEAEDAYQSYRDSLDTASWDSNDLFILDYLDIVSKHNQATFLTASTEFVNRVRLSDFANESWNCGLVANWSKQLTARKKKMISLLNEAICPTP